MKVLHRVLFFLFSVIADDGPIGPDYRRSTGSYNRSGKEI